MDPTFCSDSCNETKYYISSNDVTNLPSFRRRKRIEAPEEEHQKVGEMEENEDETEVLELYLVEAEEEAVEVF